MHEINYFEVGKTYKRTRKDVKTGGEYTSYVHIKDQKQAEYYHGMQSEYIKFELNQPKAKAWQDPFVSDAPVIRIHDSGLAETCISCEG